MKSFNEWMETRFNPEEIESELGSLEPHRQQIKKDSMVYQLEKKKEVAKAFGVDWSVFDLPFSKWDAIRTAFDRGDMEEVRNLAGEVGIHPVVDPELKNWRPSRFRREFLGFNKISSGGPDIGR